MTVVSFRRFQAEDALALRLQPSQHRELGFYRPLRTIDEARDLETGGDAWSAIDIDGRVLACAGFVETFPGRQGVAWALLAEGLGAAHLAITRYARLRIAESPLVRIEAIVKANDEGCSWARLVGMSPAAVLRKFGGDSEDCVLFERVR